MQGHIIFLGRRPRLSHEAPLGQNAKPLFTFSPFGGNRKNTLLLNPTHIVHQIRFHISSTTAETHPEMIPSDDALPGDPDTFQDPGDGKG